MTTKSNMEKGTIHIYLSEEDGIAVAAYGRAVLWAAEGKKVIVIQFIKEKNFGNPAFFKRLEPDMKIICFDNLRNGMNYARKVLATEECDLLLLADILELVKSGTIAASDLEKLLDAQGETDIILTGESAEKEISALSEKVYRIVC